jgi:hypothetical protein
MTNLEQISEGHLAWRRTEHVRPKTVAIYVAGAMLLLSMPLLLLANGWGPTRYAALAYALQTLVFMVGAPIAIAQVFESRLVRRFQAVTNQHASFQQFYASIFASKELTNVWVNGRRDPDELDETDKARFYLLGLTWFSHFETLEMLAKEGVMKRTDWISWNKGFLDSMHSSGLRQLWKVERYSFDESFRNMVDSAVALVELTANAASLHTFVSG